MENKLINKKPTFIDKINKLINKKYN